jgi:hypothetical protein
MTSSHISPPQMERQPLDVGVLRAGILALIGLIAGSMFTCALVRFSPSTPLPRPRPSVLGTAPVVTANPVGQLPSGRTPAPRNTGE